MSAPLRIVRYHPRAAIGNGGMTFAIRRWSDALREVGAEVLIACEDGASPSEGVGTWISVQHRGPGWARVPVGLDRVLDGADLLVLHSGWTAYNARAATVARDLGVPYLLEPRGAYDPHIMRRRPFAKRAWWWAAEQHIVARSAAIHLFFREELPHLEALGYRGPIVVAPNGIDEPRSSGWTGGGGGYLLWLGRFDPEHKGLDLLVKAVASLEVSQRPMIRLHGADWRGGKEALVGLINELHVGRWVAVGPPVFGEEKRRVMLAADGFLYPSRWEAFGNAVGEAVSLGIPTLCTPYPLGTHLAARGGAFLAAANPTELAVSLTAFRDRERAAAVGATGAAVARADFAWSAVASTWLEQVEGCLVAGKAAA